jgi:hypothetical protein
MHPSTNLDLGVSAVMLRPLACLLCLSSLSWLAAQEARPPKGFTALFNGKDLSGWHGMTTFDPRKLAAMSEDDRQKQLDEWNKTIPEHWRAENGVLINDGFGAYLTTDREFGDFELLVEYKTVPKADSGIYLKSTPQVQIWDHTDETQFKNGCEKGSGGLWNNSPGAPGKDPLVLADKPFGEWNTFRILQVGARTSVWLNGRLVVNHATMENYFDKSRKDLTPEQRAPLFAKGSIQLQTHGGEIQWRNIFLREIGADEANALLRKQSGGGFTPVFNGRDIADWKGATDSYEVVDGAIRCKPGKGGVLHTPEEYADFAVRLEFKLPPGGNNGLAIRYPGQGDTAYVGMCELQVLDTEHEKYGKLDPRQAHGSAYGMVAAHRGYLRPAGEWNFQEVTVEGSKIKVELNGTVILNTDLANVTEFLGNRPHPGKDRTQGYFGLAGHNDAAEFRGIEIKRLNVPATETPRTPAAVAQAPQPPTPEPAVAQAPVPSAPEPVPATASPLAGQYPSASSCCAPATCLRCNDCRARGRRSCWNPRCRRRCR